ncbi:hypothetical protein D915_003414 [Fasciola hepatica]|uniref:Sperm-associated antigen 17 n=1 Tax=Fasciola hepatica TaxID=6192 RepID=A0A4E0S2E8_FASHE|nr:hypothetical protein D915_003414 [Fasciola hepatica]
MTGFEETGLLEHLCAAQIEVHSIIRLKVKDNNQLEELIVRQKAEKLWGSKGGGQTMDELRAEQEQIELEKKKMTKYWQHVSRTMRDNPYGLLGNVATLDYVVESSLLPEDLSGTDNRLQFGLQMFDEIAAMLYDLVDFRRQWENYISHVKVIHLSERAKELTTVPPQTMDPDRSPSRSRPSAISSEHDEANKPNAKEQDGAGGPNESAKNAVDLRIYRETLGGLPLESISVELIFHAILEQVNATVNGLLPASVLEDDRLRAQGIDPEAARTMARSAEQLVLTDDERSSLSQELPTVFQMDRNNHPHGPLLIHPSDRNQLNQYFGSGTATNPEHLFQAEMELIRLCYPQLKCLFNEKSASQLLSGDDSVLSFDPERLHRRFTNVRYQQLVHFAEKHGISEEARGILRSARSVSSGQISRASRCASAVTFKLPSEHHSELDDRDLFSQQSVLSEELRANELKNILERIHRTQSTQSKIMDTPLLMGEHVKLPVTVDMDLFSKQLCDMWIDHFEDWCVEEQMTVNVMLQKIHASYHSRPCLQVIPRKADDGLLVRLDHPFDRQLRSAHRTWSSWFHVVPVGFRTYLQLIEGRIKAWTKQQEAIYQANRLSAELERAMKEGEKYFGDSIRQTGQEIPKSLQTKGKTNEEVFSVRQPTACSESLVGEADQFIVPGSLKALRKEQEETLQAKQDAERSRGEKRVQSAKRRSDLNRMACFLQFVGYDVNNCVPHWTGEITHMFPTDGGTIRTQRSELPNDPFADITDQNVEKPMEYHIMDEVAEPPVNDEAKCLEENFTENDLDANNGTARNGMQTVHGERIPSHYSSLTAHFSDGLQLTVANSAQAEKLPWTLTNASEEETMPTNTQPAVNDQKINSNQGQINGSSEVAMPTVTESTLKTDTNTSGRILQSVLTTLSDGAQITFMHMEYNEMSKSNPVHSATTALDKTELDTQTSTLPTTQDSSSLGPSSKSASYAPSTPVKVQSMILRMRASAARRLKETDEAELDRYILENGSIILITHAKQQTQNSVGIKILLPNGDKIERGTLVAERLYQNDRPRFRSDEAQVQPPQPQSNQKIDEPAPCASRRGSMMPPKGRIPGKSGRKKGEVQKKQSVDFQRQLISTSESPTKKEETRGKQAIPWLITMASGERYWFKPSRTKNCKPVQNMILSAASSTADETSKLEVVVESTSNDCSVSEDSVGETWPSTPLTVFRSYDPATGQTLFTRPEDGVDIVEPNPQHLSSCFIVHHADGTRQTQQLFTPKEQVKKKNIQEEDDGSRSVSSCPVIPQQLFRIECPGFPSVLINQTTGDFETSLFGHDSTASKLYTSSQGHHVLLHSRGGETNILPDGSVFYSSPLRNLSGLPPNQNPMLVAYGMRSDGVSSLLEAVDPQGNAFTVDALANCNVMLTIKDQNRASDRSEKNVNPKSTDCETNAGQFIQYDEHIPMLFHASPRRLEVKQLIRLAEARELFAGAKPVATTPSEWAFMPFEQLSRRVGTIRSQKGSISGLKLDSKAEVFEGEHEDQAVFVQETLQNDFSICGLTLMQPICEFQRVSHYVQDSIIPNGLATREFHSSNHQESSRSSNKPAAFAERAGHGLILNYPPLEALGLQATVPAELNLPIKKKYIKPALRRFAQPHLYLRQFIQYPVLDETRRSRVVHVLHTFTEHVLNKAIDWFVGQPLHRSHAQKRSFKALADAVFEGISPNSSDFVPQVSTNTTTSDKEVLKNDPVTSDSPLAPEDLSSVPVQGVHTDHYISPARETAYEALRQELEQAMENRATIRNKYVPNYFRSRKGIQFLMQQVPKAMAVVKALTDPVAVDVGNVQRKDISDTVCHNTEVSSLSTARDPALGDCVKSASDSQSTLADEKCVCNKKTQASLNGHVGIGNVNNSVGRKHKKFLYYSKDVFVEEKPHVPFDSVALAKHRRLRVPAYLYACRRNYPIQTTDSGTGIPAIQLNERQANIEDPVRRRQLFTSLIGGPEMGQIALRFTRGLRLQPCRVECGRMRPNSTRQFVVRLVNWGPETAWFRVRAPPERTSGIQVFYKPGPVPAGLSRKLRIRVRPILVKEEPIAFDHEERLIAWKDQESDDRVLNDPGESKTVTFVEHIRLETDTHIICLPVTGQVVLN